MGKLDNINTGFVVSLRVMPDTSTIGLSSQEALKRLHQYGPNVITVKKPSFIIKTLHWLISPMSLLLIAAVALSFYLGKTFDGWFILALFVANFAIAQWHESKADKAIAMLQSKLMVKVQVIRGGKVQLITSDQIVPGDVVQLVVGNLIPADLTITEAKNLSINTAALTGESLPQEKQNGDTVYSGSFITTGSLTGTITQTGINTKFGKAVTMVDNKPKNSTLQKDILTITKFLTLVSLSAAVIITVDLLLHHQKLADLLTLDLSVLIAGVPVAMPTVMSLIISLGVVQLTRKHVVVRRLSSLEDLANVNLLLSDKTGTLTKNEIEVENIITYDSVTTEDMLRWAYSVTTDNKFDAINQAIISRAKTANLMAYKQLDFTPADSKRKRSTALVEFQSKEYTASLGAPQIIEDLCDLDAETRRKLNEDVTNAADQGYRCLALAKGSGSQEKNLTLMGLLLLSDTLRPDAHSVIDFLQQHGIGVKMMTGDNQAIAARVATRLGLGGKIMQAAGKTSHLELEQIQQTGTFAEVLPDDKFRIVKAASAYYVVAATGDGVNDLPALRQASVGIAVNNAVDALKSAADIVLLTNGIGVIKDAIIEARQIFTRTYYYSVYRISESFRLILTIAILSIVTGSYPLTPVQIILLALLNDLPIITLAYDRVTATAKPSAVHVRERFGLASIYGTVGVLESITLFFLMKDVLHLSMAVIQTMFFLKLTVSGHLLIYVAHTKERWWKWLPSKQIIIATVLTQLAATIIAVSGVIFQGITVWQAVLVWGWALAWMQVCELAKWISQRYFTI